MPDPLLVSGWVIAAAAAAQAGWLAVDGIRRHTQIRVRRNLETELLARRVDALRQQARTAGEETAWGGWRKFVVTRKVEEAREICSFHLAPHDGKRLPEFRPGQFLTFQLSIPGQPRPVVRCYSLSDVLRDGTYRISVKRVPAPPNRSDVAPGLVSNFLHDRVAEGDILDVRAPSGQFCLESDSRPAVFIGGGIGVTPLLAMLHGLAAQHAAPESHLVLGVRNGREHPFRDELARLAQASPRLRQHVCYSDPQPDDRQGGDYERAGHVTIDFLQSILPSNNYRFYICGPPPMMGKIVPALEEWGVPESDVHFEAFGPASVKKVAAARPAEAPPDGTVEVVFEKSGRTVAWHPDEGTLLELAAAAGVALDAGCRAGNCGTCAVAVKAGTVTYRTKPSVTVEQGTCLTCCSVPASRLVLNA